ncbi:hypothetical protein Bca52824_004007 [Brassica carinata]|uniref:Uncharacterized protein n=1 Tax=Brassica carinata TaxID=52824 RepID=A0A8X8BF60_BRACI|nr:hypothetical protein Bca52824_004007 [Brassica carinata]
MAGDAEDRVKLSLKKTELENLKKKHKKIIDESKDKIRGVLKGRLPLEKDMKKEIVQALRSSVEREYDDLSLKSREAEKEVNMLQMKIQEVDNSLSKHHKDTESRKRYIESKLQALKQESFTIDAYPRLLDSKYNMATGLRQMFEPFEQVAREHHFVLAASALFQQKKRITSLKGFNHGDHVKALAAESSNADSIFQQLDKLRSVFEEYTKLTDEIIPLAEKSLQEFTEELEQKSEALDDVLAISAQIKSEKESVEALVQPLENADRLFQEIVSNQKQIEDLEYKLDFRGHGVKTMQEIQSELSSLQSTKDKLHDELEKLRDEQIYMERDISCLQARWHALREEKAKAANLLRDVTKTEEDLERLAEEKSQLDLDVKTTLFIGEY